MKIIWNRATSPDGKEFFQVNIMKEGFVFDCQVFETKKELNAFFSGFQSARLAANSLIQSLPMDLVERR